ncbi:MAG TPA: hypothetical protein VFV65_02270 [Gemmatimonadales bacterium]|nr:hypothetical protein [Gemmatimonadales bacterium]
MNRAPFPSIALPAGGGLLVAAGLLAVVGCSDSGGSGVAPEYRLSLSPSQLTLAPGGSALATISIVRTDFDGEVVFTVTSLQGGLAGFVTPAATTDSTVMLSVSAGASLSPGAYSLIVRGSAAIGDRVLTLPVTVTQPPPSFSLELDPAERSIAPGDSAGVAVIITRTDFPGPVTLALTGAPAGVTGDFDPQVSTGLGSTLTLHVDLTTVPGVYDLTVMGTGAIGNSSALLTLTVP